MDKEKTDHVSVYLKNINSFYSFLDWLIDNFGEEIKKRSDLPTVMLIVLKKITDDATKQLRFEEKNIFLKESESLEKRIRSHYEKKENK